MGITGRLLEALRRQAHHSRDIAGRWPAFRLPTPARRLDDRLPTPMRPLDAPSCPLPFGVARPSQHHRLPLRDPHLDGIEPPQTSARPSREAPSCRRQWASRACTRSSSRNAHSLRARPRRSWRRFYRWCCRGSRYIDGPWPGRGSSPHNADLPNSRQPSRRLVTSASPALVVVDDEVVSGRMHRRSAWRSAPGTLKVASGLFVLELALICGGMVAALLTGPLPTTPNTTTGEVTAVVVLSTLLFLGCLVMLAIGLVSSRKLRLRRTETLIFQGMVLFVSIDALIGRPSAWLFLGALLSVCIGGLVLTPSSRRFGDAAMPGGQGGTAESTDGR
jgi:hypothetical protein